VCSLEFPDLESSIWQPYSADGVVVLGLNVTGLWAANDSAELVDLFIAQSAVTFPVAMDDGQSFQSWGPAPDTSPFPLDVVIDREGIIRYVAREYSSDDLRAAIEAWK
jgi:peroxiredoxin